MSPRTERAEFYRGVRAAIAWLHEEAGRMTDPHAKGILNSAAFHLGVQKPDWALFNEPNAPSNSADEAEVQ